jgi:alpha-tubulin suppressor-like RCC1 family protein
MRRLVVALLRIVALGMVAFALLVAELGGRAQPASADTATAVTGGLPHTCALTTAGGVKCWGSNNQGQLGDGTTTQRLEPVDVSGLTSGVAAVAAGAYHTCAVTTTGGLKCWGYNNHGQAGDGTTDQRLTPVDVVGLTSGVAAVSAGYYHTCALTTTGGVKCWGYNQYGQVGDGTTDQRLTPVDVSGLTSGVAAVAAGQEHTCALTTTGGLKCWGLNGYGRLGDGTGDYRTTPVDVVGLTSGVAAVAPGNDHTCALTTTGGVKCWGDNEHGQLGDGTTTRRLTPVDVLGLASGVAAVAAGTEHTCAVMTTGGLKCWGANYSGQLGNGTKTGPETCPGAGACSTTPVDVIGFAPSVGGIAELPEAAEAFASGELPADSNPSALPYIALPALAAVTLFALTAGAWYARRRWLA